MQIAIIIIPQIIETTLIHHQDVICGVVFGRSSLRSIAHTPSVVAPRRLAPNTFLEPRVPKSCAFPDFRN